MAKRRMQVLPEALPPSAKVVASMHPRPRAVLTGGGRTTLLCGSCDYAVARRIDLGSVSGIVLRCPRCCRYNAAPA